MKLDRAFWWKHIKETFFIALMGIPWGFLMCYTCRDDLYYLSIAMLLSSCVWVFLWKGNEALNGLIDLKVSWIETPIKRFVIGLLGILIYTPLIMLGLFTLFQYLLNLNFGDIRFTLIISVVITIIISLFLTGREFLLNWRKLELDTVKLRNESLSSRFESLKSQVNPHFLFNSLNTLTNLVYENQDLAAKFIKQLSEVYRYVLDTRDRELVTKEEELKFLDSYLFLQKIRFGENLNVNMDMQQIETLFPPVTLQMLIENAIKHNIISSEQPLRITISSKKGVIEVSNNLQVKRIQKEESAGVGLANISQRYEFLTNKKLEVVKTDTEFIVRLPIIKPNQL
jgi:sensor histidine kinase YesM